MKYSISLTMLVASMLVVGAEDPNLPLQNYVRTIVENRRKNVLDKINKSLDDSISTAEKIINLLQGDTLLMSVPRCSPFDNSMRNYQLPDLRRRAASDPEKAIIEAVRGRRRGSVTALLEQGVDPNFAVDDETPLIWIAVESYIAAQKGEGRTDPKYIIEQLINNGYDLGRAIESEEGVQTILSRGVEHWNTEDLSAFINDFDDKISFDMIVHAHQRCLELYHDRMSAEQHANMRLVDEVLKMKMEQHND